MILSDAGIKQALSLGHLEISPEPREDQYTTSAVDLFLGKIFQTWDENIFKVPGTRIDLNLASRGSKQRRPGFCEIFHSKPTALSCWHRTTFHPAQCLQ
jgi:deoxycytidine triphosphate deaminase